MNEEIKDILEDMDLIVNHNKVPIYFTQNKVKILLDCITSLQQKVEQLEDIIKENENSTNILIEKYNQLEKEKDKLIEDYTYEYNLRHKLSLELSTEKDKVLELSHHLSLYSSEETMLKQINQLENIRKEAIELIKKYQRKDGFLNLNEWQTRDLLNILNKGSDKE